MARQPEQRNAPCSSSKPAAKPQDGDLDPRVTRVGNHLRGLYTDALDEAIPDSFKDLLRKLG